MVGYGYVYNCCGLATPQTRCTRADTPTYLLSVVLRNSRIWVRGLRRLHSYSLWFCQTTESVYAGLHSYTPNFCGFTELQNLYAWLEMATSTNCCAFAAPQGRFTWADMATHLVSVVRQTSRTHVRGLRPLHLQLMWLCCTTEVVFAVQHNYTPRVCGSTELQDVIHMARDSYARTVL